MEDVLSEQERIWVKVRHVLTVTLLVFKEELNLPDAHLLSMQVIGINEGKVSLSLKDVDQGKQ